MCGSEKGCQRPEELKGEPKDCSPEQVQKCHGDAGDHPCASTGGCEKPSNLLRRADQEVPWRRRRPSVRGGGVGAAARQPRRRR